MVMKDREESGRIIEPKSITELNKEYRANEDVLGQFCEDCCVVGESHYTAQRILRLSYDHWCRRNNYRGLTAVALNKALKQRRANAQHVVPVDRHERTRLDKQGESDVRLRGGEHIR